MGMGKVINKIYAPAMVETKMTDDGEQVVFDDRDRSVVGWASRPIKDRAGEVIAADAWMIDEYLANPVVLLAHRYDIPAIGHSLWVKPLEEGLKFKPSFADNAEGWDMYGLYKNRDMRAFSVGFEPKEYEENVKTDEFGQLRTLYTKVNLIEISAVTIPMNQGALVAALDGDRVKSPVIRKALETIMHESDEIKKLQETINKLNKELTEEKAGRVLSARNRTLIRQAVDKLQELLDATDENIEDDYEPEEIKLDLNKAIEKAIAGIGKAREEEPRKGLNITLPSAEELVAMALGKVI